MIASLDPQDGTCVGVVDGNRRFETSISFASIPLTTVAAREAGYDFICIDDAVTIKESSPVVFEEAPPRNRAERRARAKRDRLYAKALSRPSPR